MCTQRQTAFFFDINSALQRLDGNKKLFSELAQLFLEFCPQMLADIETAAADADSEAVRRAARSFKDALADFTRGSPFELTERLEDKASRGDLTHCDEILKALRKDVVRLLDELQSHQCT